jgi:hypothetical protein
LSNEQFQDADHKTLAQILSGGGSIFDLLNDTKIVITANGINKTLAQAIIDGDLSGGGGGGGGIHAFKVNGVYNKQTLPLNGLDGTFRFEDNATITNVVLIREIAGTTGTTQIDIQIKPPAGAYATIFTTRPAVTAAAGTDANIGYDETKPNHTTPVFTTYPFPVVAKSLMRMNLTAAETGDPNTFIVLVMYQ